MLRRKSSNVDLTEVVTGVDVDADDEGDDEQEDIDVTFGAGLDLANASTRLVASQSSRRRKSTGSASEANHYVYF